SVSCQSTGNIASRIPEMPPITNTPGRATANIIAVVKRIDPFQSVASQLKILIPVGTAIANEDNMKKPSTGVLTGVANMWCAQTSVPRNAIATVEVAIAV